MFIGLLFGCLLVFDIVVLRCFIMLDVIEICLYCVCFVICGLDYLCVALDFGFDAGCFLLW